jgi:hypothetical protein
MSQILLKTLPMRLRDVSVKEVEALPGNVPPLLLLLLRVPMRLIKFPTLPLLLKLRMALISHS